MIPTDDVTVAKRQRKKGSPLAAAISITGAAVTGYGLWMLSPAWSIVWGGLCLLVAASRLSR